jgi:zinc protease
MIRVLQWALCVLGLHGVVAAAAPKIQHWITDEGLRVYFSPARELPLLDLNIAFDAGSARDGGLPGLARLTAGMLDEGAAGLDTDAIAAAFDRVGATYSAAVGRDMAQFSLRTLADEAFSGPALDTFLAVLTRAEFPQAPLERLKRQTRVAIEQQKQRPGAVASKAFYRALYGDHPYASPVIGTEQSVARISRADVRAFYRRHYGARNAVLAIVGDLDRGDAERLAARLSKALAPGERAPALPPVPELRAPKTVRVPFPSTQAHVFIGQPAVARGDPQWPALYLGNHILGGGGFSARLVKEVRVHRGLSYSVYSAFSPMRVEGPFSIGLQTRVDQAGEAVRVAREVLDTFMKEGPTAEELEAARNNITGGWPLRFDSNAERLAYLAVIGFYGLPLDYLERFPRWIEAVTAEGIREAFTRHLDPDRMVTVIVGGRAR